LDKVTVTLPEKSDKLEFKLRVYDGLRWSEEVVFTASGN
jgi:hypothetical protein